MSIICLVPLGCTLLGSLLSSFTTRLHAGLPKPSLQIMRGGFSKRLRVLSQTALEPFALRLVPLVGHISKIMPRSAQPSALQARVMLEGKEPLTVFILGTSQLPPAPTPTRVGQEAVHDESKPFQAHDWKASHFPWPFWLVRRVDDEEEANCKLQTWLVRSVGTMSVAKTEPVVETHDVSLPVLTNFQKLEKDTELVVHWASRAPVKATKPKASTWVDAATRHFKKQKQ